jgi:hypothetical protein
MVRQAAATTSQRRRTTRQRPSATPVPATSTVYRLLVARGMTAPEATSLTALVCGLPSTDLRWSLEQLNHLLFLRRMRESGRF